MFIRARDSDIESEHILANAPIYIGVRHANS